MKCKKPRKKTGLAYNFGNKENTTGPDGEVNWKPGITVVETKVFKNQS